MNVEEDCEGVCVPCTRIQLRSTRALMHCAHQYQCLAAPSYELEAEVIKYV